MISKVPDDFRLVIEDIGMCLHDTVSSPDIAANFESLPEQLLYRALTLHSITTLWQSSGRRLSVHSAGDKFSYLICPEY